MLHRTVEAVASYEHFTWLNAIPGFNELDHSLGGRLPNSWIAGTQVDSVRHIFLALLMTFIVIIVGRAAGKRMKGPDALVPEENLNARNALEVVLDAIMGLARDGMGEKYARKTLPLVGTVTMYVFFSNILGLIPGFAPPTENLNATLAPALIVVVMTHVYGIQEHGVKNYFKHFFGPVIYIAPLYFVIEMIGHLARVLSLSFRLMGNMIGDHKVLASWLALTAFSFIFPVPFWLLGLIVCSMQTFVFALLTVIYIQLAVAHDDH